MNYLSFSLAILAILGVIYHIVRRETNSSIASFFSWIGNNIEGFDGKATTAIVCPKGMKFFVNERGVSFCCGGAVNPYGASCSDPAKLCAFEPNVPDPRGHQFGFVSVCKP